MLRNPLKFLVGLSLIALSGCGGDDSKVTNLSGQVLISTAAPAKVSHYAASRFLEHAAMGPSPDSVAQVRRLGFDAWIDAQLKAARSTISTPTSLISYDNNQDRAAQERANNHHGISLMNIFVAGDDQLRIRTSWVLSNFLVVSNRKIQFYGASEYFNTLQLNAFGQYGDLLKAVTRSPAMGFYLDNGNNNKWNLNENYGRELLQLFSVGLVQLNLDGTIKRDNVGKPLETYNQSDVLYSTKALTGWQYAPRESTVPNDANWANYGVPMVPANSDSHDTGAKTLLGKAIPSGQDATMDLDSLVNILVDHPNTAPFVSLRLIQGLTTSDPSPGYLGRVASVFRQTRGNLGQVVRAILQDSEARAGDAPAAPKNRFGRIKEPHLINVSVQRGLGCRMALRQGENEGALRPWMSTQRPFNAYSVFNYYPPNHRAPGSNLAAPEQKTLNSEEFSSRLGEFSYTFSFENNLVNAGCDVQSFKKAAAESDDKVISLLSDRLFRGSISSALRQGLMETRGSMYRPNPMALTGAMVDLASITPAFGVSK